MDLQDKASETYTNRGSVIVYKEEVVDEHGDSDMEKGDSWRYEVICTDLMRETHTHTHAHKQDRSVRPWWGQGSDFQSLFQERRK